MRLSEFERDVIRNAVLSVDKKAKVFLFGSRADDTKRGGDIDILIYSKQIGRREKFLIEERIFKFLEEQKIDLVVAGEKNKSFVRLIKKKSVPL